MCGCCRAVCVRACVNVVLTCNKPSPSKPTFNAWTIFLTPVMHKPCCQLRLNWSIKLLLKLKNSHAAQSFDFNIIGQLINPSWRFWRLRCQRVIWPKLIWNSINHYHVFSFPQVRVVVGVHLQILIIVIHCMVNFIVWKSHRTNHGSILLLDLFQTHLLVWLNLWSLQWAFSWIHIMGSDRRRRPWSWRCFQRTCIEIVRCLRDNWTWIRLSWSRSKITTATARPSNIIWRNLIIIMHINWNDFSITKWNCATILERQGLTSVMEPHVSILQFFTFLFSGLFSNSFSICIKESWLLNLRTRWCNSKWDGFTFLLHWYNSVSQWLEVPSPNLEVQVERQVGLPTRCNTPHAMSQDKMFTIIQQVTVLRINLSNKQHAFPLGIALCRGLHHSQNWLTKLRKWTAIILGVDHLKASLSLSCIEPVEQPWSMSHCPWPERIIRPQLNTQLLAQSMHQCSSKASNTLNCIFHQTILVTVGRWRVGPCWQAHSLPGVDCHPQQLPHSWFIVTRKDHLTVSQALCELNQLTCHHVKIAFRAQRTCVNIAGVTVNHHQTRQLMHLSSWGSFWNCLGGIALSARALCATQLSHQAQ